MILKGSQRGGGNQLAAHLLRTDHNDHVSVHELRGFMAEDLQAALQEAYAVSKGTRAKQFLFSLSLNPPPEETVSVETFEAAVNRIEYHLGLEGQPRAIVFHEKEGRRHAHAVWSRINTSEMKAINLPHYKRKLTTIAKELYLEHGWQMPPGFSDTNARNPLNFTHEEWQQAQRNKLDPRALKQMFKECWAISDSCKAYEQALQTRGYWLARGDRRGYVAVDYRGEPYAIAKYTGIKTKQVRERLGDPKDLASIDQVRAKIGELCSARLRAHLDKAREERTQKRAAAVRERKQLIQRQRQERKALDAQHQARQEAETRIRSKRLARGLRGVWHRLTGQYKRVKCQNEQETLLAWQRDRGEKDALVTKHIEQRRNLQTQLREKQAVENQDVQNLREQVDYYEVMRGGLAPNLKKEFDKMKDERRIKPRQQHRPSNTLDY